MEQKEIHDLIKLINKTNISEFKMKDGDFSLSIRTKEFQMVRQEQQILPVVHTTAQPSISAAPSTETPAPANTDSVKSESKDVVETTPKKEENENTIAFKSPMIGTFYRRPTPDKDPFIKVGDTIKKGDIVCIIEAMKLFNEIESEIDGTVVKVLVDDNSPVEYDQPLFLIEPA